MTIVLISQAYRGRSAIAAGYLRAYLGDDVEVRCFGGEPDDLPDPAIDRVMREDGILMRPLRQTPIDPLVLSRADRVVTMGLEADIAERVGRVDEEWRLPDPEGRPLGEIRAIRDEIKRRVSGLAGALLKRHEVSPPAGFP